MKTDKMECDQDFFRMYDLNDAYDGNELPTKHKNYYDKNNHDLYINLLGDD